ncbi:antA/AntB antirepressor family protein [uncultured Campylobacter sp.]|uniref:antA/AntB antirepressor family protein n=1 Tax=uncultured Campylobacter sp. TaxID=218934 RepID=UPI002635B51A|nr:antA/AntB antirepressor family protein [uncultured Campylobacter sp.]
MQLSLTFPTAELQGAFPANAEILFKFLNPDTKFADWITRRITQYGFALNQDYIIQVAYTKGRPRKEYFITLDMAKELCMVENNERGKEARRYFIKCEQELQALKFQYYVDEISNLRAVQISQGRHNQNVINGYKSQISQHNALIVKLKSELAKRGVIYDAEVIERYEQKEENLRAMLHNAKTERDFYRKRTQELKQKQNIKDSEIVRLLNKIQYQMDGVYSEIGAVMAYANDNDRFFIEQNEILKG